MRLLLFAKLAYLIFALSGSLGAQECTKMLKKSPMALNHAGEFQKFKISSKLKSPESFSVLKESSSLLKLNGNWGAFSIDNISHTVDTVYINTPALHRLAGKQYYAEIHFAAKNATYVVFAERNDLILENPFFKSVGYNGHDTIGLID